MEFSSATFQTGARFSLKARLASLLSSVKGARRGLEGTTRNVFKVHIFHFVNQVSRHFQREVTCANRFASSGFALNSARGTTFVTKPKRPASAASIGSPVRINSAARIRPDEFL